MILIYITNSTEEEAENTARHLIELKLIACGNIFPVKSIFRWENEVQKETEFVLVAKTEEEKFEKVKSEIEKIHSYKVPCILKIEADSNGKYLDWLREELK